eukprot:scaffold93866_cov56-Phaeocystis_antarctica.AAC.3
MTTATSSSVAAAACEPSGQPSAIAVSSVSGSSMAQLRRKAKASATAGTGLRPVCTGLQVAQRRVRAGGSLPTKTASRDTSTWGGRGGRHRRLWAGARAPPQPLSGIHAARAFLSGPAGSRSLAAGPLGRWLAGRMGT